MNDAHPAEFAAIESRGTSPTESTAESSAALADNSETAGEAPPKTVAAMQSADPNKTSAADSASTKKLVKKPHFMQRYGSRGEFFEFDGSSNRYHADGARSGYYGGGTWGGFYRDSSPPW
jgi:hypothetical protein